MASLTRWTWVWVNSGSSLVDGQGGLACCNSCDCQESDMTKRLNWTESHWLCGWQQFSLVAQSCLTLCNAMDGSMPSFPVHHQLPEFSQTHIQWVGDAIHPSHPLLVPLSIFPSLRFSYNESFLHIRWPKYWSFSFSISLSNEYSGLISFRMDWLDLLAVQGTLKSLLQHHSSKASKKHQFFNAQLSS